jgi:hypothetical protein
VIVLVLGIYPLLILDLQSPALVALAEKVVAAAPSATHLAAVGAGH